MDEPLTPTRLRANLYRILDHVLETGEPVEVERKGRKVRIAAVPEDDPFAKLQPHPGFITGDPEDLVEMDWSKEWKPCI